MTRTLEKYVLSIIVVIAGINCQLPPQKFNISGKKILYREKPANAYLDTKFTIVLLNLDSGECLSMVKKKYEGYGNISFLSNAGKLIGKKNERINNTFKEYDLKNNDYSSYLINNQAVPDTDALESILFKKEDDTLLIRTKLGKLILSTKGHKAAYKALDISTSRYSDIAFGNGGIISVLAKPCAAILGGGYVYEKLIIYNYWTGKMTELNDKLINLSNWSPDGKKLIVTDTDSSPIIITYPDMQKSNLGKIFSDSLRIIDIPYFIDNDIILINVIPEQQLETTNFSTNLYLYDIRLKTIIRQVTNTNTIKFINDVTYK